MGMIILNGVEYGTSGGSNVSAFVRAQFPSGSYVTATKSGTTLTSDTSGDYVFALPDSGYWTFNFSSGSAPRTISTSYGDSIRVIDTAIFLPNSVNTILAEADASTFDYNSNTWGGLSKVSGNTARFHIVDDVTVTEATSGLYYQASNQSLTAYFVTGINTGYSNLSRILTMSSYQDPSDPNIACWFYERSTLYMYDSGNRSVSRSPFVVNVFSASLDRDTNVAKWYLNGELTRTTNNKTAALNYVSFASTGSSYTGSYNINLAAVVNGCEDDATIIANHQNLMTIFGVTT